MNCEIASSKHKYEPEGKRVYDHSTKYAKKSDKNWVFIYRKWAKNWVLIESEQKNWAFRKLTRKIETEGKRVFDN